MIPPDSRTDPGSVPNMEWDVRSDVPPGTEPPFAGRSDLPPLLPPLGEDDGDAAAPFNLDLRRFIIGAWQRRYLAMAAFSVIVLVLFTAILFGVPRNWQAHTTLIKRTHQDIVTLAERDPFKSQDYSLATLLDTLKLPSSLNAVAAQAGLKINPISLASALDVALNRDSTILNLKLTWNDPAVAADLVNRVAAQFIERTAKLVQDDAAEGFAYYTGQLENARIAAQAASAEVLAFRQQNGISDLSTQTRVLLEDLSALTGDHNERLAEVDALRQAQQRLRAAIEAEPEQMIMYTIYRSPLQTRLAEYEWQLEDALTKYTPENPKVAKLEQSIRTLKDMIAANNDQAVPENTYTQNNKRYQMELREQEVLDEIQVKQAQAEAIADTLTEMQGKIDSLNAHEKEYLMLQSRLDGVLTLETNLSRRVEETRLVMQRQDSMFDVVEAATPPPSPLPSMRKLLAAASVVFAGLCAAVLVLALEWFDPFVRSLRDLLDLSGTESGMEIGTGRGIRVRTDQPMSPLANDYRRLCNDIDTGSESGPERIGVLSVAPHEGRSTVAANLALTRVMKGQRTLLVDADLRTDAGARPSRVLGLADPATGLYGHLVEGRPLETLEHLEGRLRVLSAGPITDSRGLLELGASRFEEVIERSGMQSHTIIDLPPLQDLEVTLELASHVDSILLVARSGVTRRSDLKAAVARLKRRGIPIRASLMLDVPVNRLADASLITLPKGPRWWPPRWLREAGHAH